MKEISAPRGLGIFQGIRRWMVRQAAPRILKQVLKAAAPTVPLIIIGSCDNPPTRPQPSDEFQVDRENLENLVVEISSRNRRIFTDGNRETEVFLEARFRELLGERGEVALQPVEVPDIWVRGLEAEFPGIEITEIHNILARIPGRDSSRKLVFTAHLDSLGEGIDNEIAPGANDNATGLAVLLEILRNIAPHEFPFDIEVVAFNSEEKGRLGSKTYVEGLADGGQSVLAVINLDALGNRLAPDRLVVTTDGLARPLAELFRQVNLENGTVAFLEIRDTACSSDECSFRTAKIPDVLLSENSSPVAEELYPGFILVHTSADTSELVNPELVAKAAELALGVLAKLAEGEWERLVRPKIQFVEIDFRYLANMGGEELFLTVQEEETTGLTYGLLYDQQGNPRYQIELGYYDESFGEVVSLDGETIMGRLSLPPDPVTGRLPEPLDLDGTEILDPVGNPIGRISTNSSYSRPADTEAPLIEISEPGDAEILTFPRKSIRVRGRTEPGLEIVPPIISFEKYEAEKDGTFEAALPFPDSLSMPVDLSVEDAMHNESSVRVGLNVPVVSRSLDIMTMRFYGETDSLADHPVWARIAERITQSGRGANFRVITDPLQSLDFEGSSQPGTVYVSLKSPSIPEGMEKLLASMAAHEFFHAIDRMDAEWADLYDQGRALGTWDLLDDSVLGDYYAWAGHPKGLSYEGFASAGQAYVVYAQTFRTLIDLLASPELPAEPFAGNQSLNRVLPIIWEQTPDRSALRQNLIDIYNFFRDNYLSGHEFETDF